MEENYVPKTTVELKEVALKIIKLLDSERINNAEAICVIALVSNFQTFAIREK